MNDKIITEIDGIEFIYIDKVIKIQMLFSESNTMDLIVDCNYTSTNDQYYITISLTNVTDFGFSNQLNEGYVDISEIKIHDISDRQLENCNFEIEDYGGSGFNCRCDEIIISKPK